MKKLLIAMMSVASLAFISKAETFTGTTGTSFESLEIGAELSVGRDDAGTTAGKKLWSSTAESVGVVTNANLESYTATCGKPAIAGETDAKALMVEAESRLVRSIDVVENTGASISFDIGSGIYFDTMVQFTATETAPTPTAGDKLVVWLYGSGDENDAFGIGTNLVVTAGYLTDAVSVVPTNYVVTTASAVEPNSWHRLTIKSIADVGNDDFAGFVVFIDGVAVTSAADRGAEESIFATGDLNDAAKVWAGKNQLFPSLVISGNDKATLTSVSLEGTGMIDDISFTSEVPFADAGDVAQFILRWDSHVTGMTVKVGSDDAVVLTEAQVGAGSYAITLPADIGSGLTVAVTPGFDQDWGFNAWVLSENGVTREDNTFTVTGASSATLSTKETAARATLTIDGEATVYATLAAALADTRLHGQDAMETEATITLTENATGSGFFGEEVTAVITLDLNGFTITGDAENTGSAVIDNYTILTIKDSSSSKTGAIVAVGEQIAVANRYALTVEAGKVTGVVDNSDVPPEEEAAGCFISGGSFSGAEGTFYLSSYITEGLTATYSAGYWTVGEGGEEQDTYKVKVNVGEGTTVSDAPTAAVAAGTEVELTVGLEDGYKTLVVKVNNVVVAPDENRKVTFTVNATTTVDLSATKITYATLTITPVDNCTIVVTNGDDVVTTGAKFDVDDKVELTVTRAAANGYELDGYQASETITMTNDVEVTAAVKSTTPAKDYPAYIADGDKQKYDTWASTYEIADRKDTHAALQDAYLLNVAPDKAESEAAKFACVSITVNGTTVTVTASAENSDGNAYNGTVEIKGSATLTGTYNLETSDKTARFFKAFLK